MKATSLIVLKALELGLPVKLFPDCDEVYLSEDNQLYIVGESLDTLTGQRSEKLLPIECSITTFLNACKKLDEKDRIALVGNIVLRSKLNER